MPSSRADDIPEDVRCLIIDSIDSVEQLQVLLLLLEQPKRVWLVPDITAELRSSDGSIEKRLSDLYGRRILRREPGDELRHTYLPFSPEIDPVIRRLAEVYRQRPNRVIDLIYSRPNEALRAFADAFKIKKDR
jgi:hypothetical protein